MADTPVRIAYRSYLIHHRDHFPLAVVVGFFEHQDVYKRQELKRIKDKFLDLYYDAK